MRRLALPAALLPTLLAVLPASAVERFVGSVPQSYGRDGRAYYAPSSYYGRARSETHSSSAYFRGFSIRRTVTEAEAEVGYGPAPRREPPTTPPNACGGGGLEVVNAGPGEATCVGRPRR